MKPEASLSWPNDSTTGSFFKSVEIHSSS